MSTAGITAMAMAPLPSVRPTTGGVLRVPWATVVPLAVVFAFADEFWIVALRGAVGSISRTDAPFTTWLRESTLMLPVYAFAVLAALTLALRWFGPHSERIRAAATTLPLVVAAATLAAFALLAMNTAYDYQLQSAELQAASGLHGACDAGCLAERQQATLGLHLRALGLGGLLLLVTNLVLGGLVVAFRGGRIDVASPGRQASRLMPWRLRRAAEPGHDGRVHAVVGDRSANRLDELRVLLAAGLVGAAVIHNVVSPDRLIAWPGAGTVLGMLCAAEIVVALLVVARLSRAVAVAAVIVSVVPLLLWFGSDVIGLPFGLGAGAVEPVGLVDGAVVVLHAMTLTGAIVVLRARSWLREPVWSQHLTRLVVVAVVAATVAGLGSGLSSRSGPVDVGEPATHAHGR